MCVHVNMHTCTYVHMSLYVDVYMVDMYTCPYYDYVYGVPICICTYICI